jgi:D-alanyl-D-alanine carboxypeptidase
MAQTQVTQRGKFRPGFRALANSLPKIALFGALILTAGTALAAPDRSAALIMDYSSGTTLYARNADEPRHPASLTKMMTLFMAFEAIQQGRLSMDQKLLVSQFAADQAPTKLGLRPGSTILVRDAVMGLVTKSANDAAATLAENMAGSEPAFARQMTQRARRLGMSSTLFANASGLPNDAQITTARDMAVLGRALIRDFPEFYPLFSTKNFVYQGRVHPNHNRLMNVYDGMDGIKTGFIRASGFNLVASAKRDGRRLVGAVFGGTSPGQRDQLMAKLMDAGFAGTLVAMRENEAPQRSLIVAADGPKQGIVPVNATMSTRLPARANGGATITPVSATLGRAAAPVLTPTVIDTPRGQTGQKQATAQPVSLKPQGKPQSGGWAVQVCAFATGANAHKAAQAATASAKAALGRGTIAVAEGKDAKGARVYRARIAGLTEKEARDACQSLTRQKNACVAVPAS